MSRKKVIQITWLTAQYIVYLLQSSFLSTEEQRKVSLGVKSAKLVCEHIFLNIDMQAGDIHAKSYSKA